MIHDFKNIKKYNLFLILIATQAPSVACKPVKGVGLLKEKTIKLLSYHFFSLSENKKKSLDQERLVLIKNTYASKR